MKKFDSKKTVFLIDGSSFLYRAYYGLRPLHGPQGNQVQAVYGFVRMIKKLIDTFSPEFMALVWDSPGKTTRHEMFQEYKATRQAPPSDLFEQKEIICRFADMIDLAQVKKSGIEADDLMYSVAHDLKKEGYDVVIISSDKDMGQMLDEHTFIYDAFKDEVHDTATFAQKMGFAVQKLPFYFALLGDSSDNIPGVRGIGKKGALDLVLEYDSLEQLYAHLDQVKSNRARTALQENKDNAFLSRDLFLLQYHVCDLSIEHVRFHSERWAGARPLFKELNFKSLLADIGPEKVVREASQSQHTGGQMSLFGGAGNSANLASDVPAKKNIEYTFKKVVTLADLHELADALKEKKLFAMDTETTGIKPLTDPMVGLSFSTEIGKAWYVPFGHHVEEAQLSKQEIVDVLGPILKDSTYKKVFHHASFDVAVLRHAGMPVNGIVFDTMVAARLVNAPGQKAGLKDLSEKYLGDTMLTYEQVVKDNKYKNFSYVPLDLATHYAAADAHQTLRLYPLLQQRLAKEGFADLYEKIEQPLLNILLAMEHEGIGLDRDQLAELGKRVMSELIELEDAVIKMAGDKFADINLNSPKQVQELLFEELKLPPQKKSAKGSYSTDSEVLEALAKLHPIPGMIAKYRELAKLKNTYIDALPTYIDPSTQRIHTSFNQSSVATGRLSSSDPNLQNIPADAHGYGIEIRAAFKPQEGHVFLSADYSQIELRVMAYLSQDVALKQAFAQGQDVHAQTAARLFDTSVADVTHAQRQIGKRINFSVLYGMTPYGLSKDLGISFADARRYIDTYFEQYPGVQVWMDQVVAQAKELGYVSTLWGHRRYTPGLYEANQALYQQAVREAVNTVVQGTAADIMKIGMIKLSEALTAQKIPAKVLLQIHDELLLSVPKGLEALVEEVARRALTDVVRWDVPLQVTTRVGADWKEVTK
jgi:DNA polymerase-1